MQFEYRGFNIECATEASGASFVGSVTISRLQNDDDEGETFNSGYLKSFPTRLQAIGYARIWAEMWCDEQLSGSSSPRPATGKD
jgi:hypothetical protein